MNNKYPCFKMRLWDKATSTMYTPASEKEYLEELSDKRRREIDKNFNFKINLCGSISQYDVWCSTDIIPMLWTTLCDKNKSDIYDGDIIKFEGFYHKKNDVVGIIKFDHKRALFGIMEIGGFSGHVQPLSCFDYNGTDGSFRGGMENCEVIGNIYQNPELLEDKNAI